MQPAVGPIIQVLIGVSSPRQQALTAAGIAIPAPVTGNFLIDTGASGTCVDPDLVKKLGIPPSGSISIQTPSTQGNPHQCSTYDVMLFIPSSASGGHFIEVMPVFETHLSGQGIDGLLGRDVLQNCVLIYNGTTNLFTLSY
jgi:hypothetical protein